MDPKLMWKNSGRKETKGGVIKTYWTCGSFLRRCYYSPLEERKFQLLHYLGSRNNLIERKKHGNSRNEESTFLPSHPKLLELIREKKDLQKPGEIYSDLNVSGQASLEPRNPKQVYNALAKERSKIDAEGGALGVLLEMQARWKEEGKEYLKYIQLYPDFLIFFAHDELINLLSKCVCDYTAKAVGEALKWNVNFSALQMDPTYNMGSLPSTLHLIYT